MDNSIKFLFPKQASDSLHFQTTFHLKLELINMDRNICKECGREFKKVGKLQRHIREIHQNLKPFKCDICDKEFKRNSHLKRHMTCHSENPKPFFCSLDGCTQRFSNKHHLVRHIKLVHDQDRYRCKSCDMSFKKKKLLQKHLIDEHGSFQGPETVDSTRTPRYSELPFEFDDSIQKKIKKEGMKTTIFNEKLTKISQERIHLRPYSPSRKTIRIWDFSAAASKTF